MRVYEYKYDIKEHMCREMKDGVNATTANFSDSTARGTLKATILSKKDNNNLSISLSRTQVQSYGWLKCDFELDEVICLKKMKCILKPAKSLKFMRNTSLTW